MKITLKDIAIAGAGAVAGILWYEYICQKICQEGRMYRVLKRSDGTYQVYGNVSIIPPEDKDKITAATETVESEPWGDTL